MITVNYVNHIFFFLLLIFADNKNKKIMDKEILKKLQSIETYTMLAAKTVLSLDEVVLLTGLSKSYIYKLTSNHKIPYYKPAGKQIFFDRVEIEAWLKRGRVNTREEIEEQAVSYLVTGKMKGGSYENKY